MSRSRMWLKNRHQEQIVRLLEQLGAGKLSIWEIWEDFILMSAISIYGWVLMRYSISEIRDLLHIYHIPSPQGKEFWSHATILYILSNERYAGNVTMQKTFVQDLFSHKSVKNRGQLPKYEIIDYHPKLVSETDWIEVQRILFSTVWTDFLRTDYSITIEPNLRVYPVEIGGKHRYATSKSIVPS